jgi:chemotaxis protein MotB
MGRKKHEVHEEHENHERWLVSYADFITLLFAFFVVMYATRSDDAQKLQQLASALKSALSTNGGASVLSNGAGRTPAAMPNDESGTKGGGNQDELNQKFREMESRLAKYVRQPRPPVVIVNDGKRLAIRLQANSFFNAGEAVLKPDALQVLDAVGRELAELNRPIRVEGHTDSTAVSTAKFQSNWSLSAARAVTVTEFLIKAHRVPESMLAAAGYSSTRPLPGHDKGTEEDNEANRRIEMVVSLSPADRLDGLVQ